MGPQQRSAVKLYAEASRRGHRHEPVLDRNASAHDYVFRLPRIVRVERVGEVRHRRTELRHGRERNAGVIVGVHGYTAAKSATERGEIHGGAQAAPKVMIGKNDVLGASADA